MFAGRTQELERLEGLYALERNSVIVLYGRSGIGKTSLVRRFVKDKAAVYYAARRVTAKEQLYCMKQEREEAAAATDFYEVFGMLYAAHHVAGQKLVLVFDEFRNLLEEPAEFLTAFVRFYMEHHGDGTLLVLLLSSSISWVENEMTRALGTAAKLLNGFIKLKEFSFMELAGYHRQSSVKDNIYTGAVLGGVPAYLRLWRERESFEANVVRLFLAEDALLYAEAEHYLKQELRELSAYNTILAALAQGRYKLNDIYEQTGFSRAKISVYLKNLTELGITEKLFSFETREYKEVQKGLYRIREPYVRFWYRFIYPNRSAIAMGQGERVYREQIAPYLTEYVAEAFRNVCGEYLQVLNDYRKLGMVYGSFGIWHGKNGSIDVLAKADSGEYLAGFCDCREELTDVEHFREYERILESAGVRPKECYCFSMQGFTGALTALAGENGLCLVCAGDM